VSLEQEQPDRSSDAAVDAVDRAADAERALSDDADDIQPFDSLLTQDRVNAPALATAMEQQEAPDAADALESLEEDQAVEVLGEMDDQLAADALTEMQVPLAVGVLDDLIDDDANYAALLLELMAPDDAADLLQALDPERRSKALGAMDAPAAKELAALLHYDEESAGGIMTTDFLTLRDDMSVQKAIDFVRSSPVSEGTHSALVIDKAGRLTGVVPLRKLLIVRTADRIGDIMDPGVHVVTTDTDREHVAHEIDRYGCDMMPVVDAQGRPLGIVTVDDVIDIIRAEHTEDVQRSVGAGAREAVYSPLGTKIKSRFPWLLVNLFTSTVAAFVVLQFEDLIESLAILAVLMPVIANQAGNAGQQSLAVALRGIVLDEVRSARVWPLLGREAVVGFLNGVAAGVLVGGGLALVSALFWEDHNWRVGVVAGLAMMFSLSIGCFVGSSMPILLRRYGFDPATGSTIFLTMTTDTISFFTFLGLAQLLSEWLLIQ
jgi:magnesium transporter